MSTVVWVDLETGGTEDRHPTTQVAAVAEADGLVLEELDIKIRFDPEKCEREALELQNYSPERWVEAVDPREALRALADFTRRHATIRPISGRTGKPYDAALVGGYNVERFDFPRLRRGFDAAGIYWPARWWYPLDVYWLAAWRFAETAKTGLGNGPRDLSLGAVAEHLGIDAEGAHDALADCHITRRVATVLRGEWHRTPSPEEGLCRS